MFSGYIIVVFVGLIFFSFYLNGKLKVFLDYYFVMWKLVVLYVFVFGVCLIGGVFIIDEYYNWYDVFVGVVIGIVFVFSVYWMMYVLIWDWRWNYVLLNCIMFFIFGYGG